jgi:16S rRNA G966 N2-methylase RsmD
VCAHALACVPKYCTHAHTHAHTHMHAHALDVFRGSGIVAAGFVSEGAVASAATHTHTYTYTRTRTHITHARTHAHTHGVSNVSALVQ